MSKTGNNTNATQWLYVKINVPFVWRWKIGITGRLWLRTKQTSADVAGFYVPVAFVRVPFAWTIEQAILNATVKHRRQILGGGGREVRPWYIGIIAALIVYALGVIKWLSPFILAFGLAWLIERV